MKILIFTVNLKCGERQRLYEGRKVKLFIGSQTENPAARYIVGQGV